MSKCNQCNKTHENDNTGCLNSGYYNSGDYNSGYRNSGYYNSGYYNSGDRNSGYRNSGDYNSGYRNSGYRNSGDYNSGDRNSGDRNSGYRNSGDYNSGDRNSGYRNSGDYNSGDRNSGIFNTDEPKMRSFNKECDLIYTEFRNKFGYNDLDLPVCAWINKADMTDEEKKANPTHKDTGGYLKTLSYKEAWAKAWSEATDEQKNWYKNLPNFDANIFKKITGIDVSDSLVGTEFEAKINGKTYKAKIIQ